jgi:PAS domain S-box-containing protein
MATAPRQLTPFLGLGTEAALRALGDALPEAVFTTDLDGRVTWWNAAAERITGYAAAEAIGQRCSLLAGDAVNGCTCGRGPLRCGLAERGKTSKRCTCRAKDGRLLTIVKSAVPLQGPDGELVGALERFTVAEAGDGAATACGAAAGRDGDFFGLTGRHSAMRELYRLVAIVARSDATVMIVGESGAGKERVAEAIHRAGPRAASPFVRLPCAALDEVQLERELAAPRPDACGDDPDACGDDARAGTLLLDEVGDLPPALQARLLRQLERREADRAAGAGGVRLLCTTHHDLRALVGAGRFRADLYFRLHVLPLRVPPLRERIDDLAPLAAEFLLAHAPPRALAQDALDALGAHGWPGNVRELHNVLAFAALQADEGVVRTIHLPQDVRGRSAAPVADDRDAVVAALQRCGWNRDRAARVLGVSRVTLWKRMKAMAIDAPARREPGAGPPAAPEDAAD